MKVSCYNSQSSIVENVGHAVAEFKQESIDVMMETNPFFNDVPVMFPTLCAENIQWVVNGPESVGRKTEAILDAIKPEAVYFTEMNGQPTIVMVAELEKASLVPALAEPWFLTFSAAVEFRVIMSLEDLKEAGLEALGRKWG